MRSPKIKESTNRKSGNTGLGGELQVRSARDRLRRDGTGSVDKDSALVRDKVELRATSVLEQGRRQSRDRPIGGVVGESHIVHLREGRQVVTELLHAGNEPIYG